MVKDENADKEIILLIHALKKVLKKSVPSPKAFKNIASNKAFGLSPFLNKLNN